MPRGSASPTAEKSRLRNGRGAVRLHAKLFDRLRRGVLVAESIWPNDAYEDGRGINADRRGRASALGRRRLPRQQGGAGEDRGGGAERM